MGCVWVGLGASSSASGLPIRLRAHPLRSTSPHIVRTHVEQKWSKGKMREKVANKVLFDQETYDNRLLTEIPKVRKRAVTSPHGPHPI